MEDSDKDRVREIKHTCLSQVVVFNNKADCINCGQYISTEKPISQKSWERDYINKVWISDLLPSIIAKALGRNDTWGKEVRIIVPNVDDVATAAKYHH